MIKHLVLNYALGFREPNLNFLQDLPLVELTILANVDDPKPIYSLAPTLRSLSLNAPVKFLDLVKLPDLERLGADWPQVRDSMGMASNLSHIYLGRYKEKDFSALGHLQDLRQLRLKDRPSVDSLDGLNSCVMEDLGIFLAKNLVDTSALKLMKNLTILELESCHRINSLDSLEDCRQIETLNIANSGHIDSLAPLAQLVKIESLRAYENTNIRDGDLSVLQVLPELKVLRMMNRQHYSPSVATVQQGLRG